MTTGRINQVTTFHPHSILTTLLLLLSRSGVRQKVDHNLVRGLTETHSQLSAQLVLTHLSVESANQIHLVPQGPTFFRLSSSCQLILTKITTFKGNCLQLALNSVTADSQLSLIAHLPALPLATSPHLPCSIANQIEIWLDLSQLSIEQKSLHPSHCPSQASTSLLDRPIHDSVQNMPVFWGILDLHMKAFNLTRHQVRISSTILEPTQDNPRLVSDQPEKVSFPVPSIK